MFKQVILAVVLFYVVSNPATYKLVDSFIGSCIRITKNGSPTPNGLLIHTLLFGAILVFLLPNISGLVHTHEHEHDPDGLSKHVHVPDVITTDIPKDVLMMMTDEQKKEVIDKILQRAKAVLSEKITELNMQKKMISEDMTKEIERIDKELDATRREFEDRMDAQVQEIMQGKPMPPDFLGGGMPSDLPGSMMPLDFQEAGMPGAMLDKKEAFQNLMNKINKK
jgi:hypothetical protein